MTTRSVFGNLILYKLVSEKAIGCLSIGQKIQKICINHCGSKTIGNNSCHSEAKTVIAKIKAMFGLNYLSRT